MFFFAEEAKTNIFLSSYEIFMSDKKNYDNLRNKDANINKGCNNDQGHFSHLCDNGVKQL